MQHNTKLIGNITEIQVQLEATKLGIQVSIPYGDHARYDQIWDVNGKLLKIQIKKCNLKNGCIEINCKSSTRKCGEIVNKRYTKEEIDYLVTYYNDKCYIIPVEQLPSRVKTLRLEKPNNNQQIGISYAEDYELSKFIENNASLVQGLEQ